MHTLNAPWSSSMPSLMMDRISLDDVPHKGNRGNFSIVCLWIMLNILNKHEIIFGLFYFYTYSKPFTLNSECGLWNFKFSTKRNFLKSFFLKIILNKKCFNKTFFLVILETIFDHNFLTSCNKGRKLITKPISGNLLKSYTKICNLLINHKSVTFFKL